MGSEMKGLHQFIADLRAVGSKEAHDQRINEEIVNIQKQFNQNDRLNGYQKKKYVTKLIYIYLMSSCNISAYNVTFGSKQALELISSKVYSEKFIGYLSVSLLFNSLNNSKDSVEADFITLITNSIKKDLASNNEEFNCLALQCIATLGNPLWSSVLVEDVFQILRSPTSSPLLKKKSSLAVLQLVRADKTTLMQHSSWVPRILALSDDKDLGVVQSLLPLIEFIAAEVDFDQVRSLIPTFTKKLSILVLEPDSVSEEYFFAKTANPWLIVKLTRLLTILIPEAGDLNIDLVTLRKLRECVSTVIQFASRTSNDSAVTNAHNAVLFSMIHLAGLLNPSKDAMISSIDAVSSLLDSDQSNTRYLALNSLITLTSKSTSPAASRKHLMKVFSLLKEHDVSIAKKSLELIYTLTDTDSVGFIVEELFKILKTSDHVIKQEIAIKISVLCEIYATSPSWFVQTMLELIDNAGVSLNESIWERVVQIIVNNESLQQFTCKEILKYITKPKFSESMVKIAAYILGEFALLINDEIPIQKQFEIMTNIYFYVSNNTKVMILTSFMKMLKFDIHNKTLKSNLIKILRVEVNSVNVELQQRAYEYLSLIQKLNTRQEDLFMIIFEEIPVFNTAENKLLLKLAKSNPTQFVKSSDNLSQKLQKGNTLGRIDEDFKDLDLTGDSSSKSQEASKLNPRSDGPLTPNWQKGFYRLFEYNQGLFFENSLIKILLRTNKCFKGQKDLNSYSLSFINKSPQEMTSFIISLTSYKTVKPDIVVSIIELPNSDIGVNQKTSCNFDVNLRNPYIDFDEIPNLKIQFNTGGAFNSIRLKLPIFLTKFIKPTTLTVEQFNQHWSQIDALGDSGESIKTIESRDIIDEQWLERFVEKIGFGKVGFQDNGLLASGILHTSSKGSFGVLLKTGLTYEFEATFSIRVTSPNISSLIMHSIEDFFAH